MLKVDNLIECSLSNTRVDNLYSITLFIRRPELEWWFDMGPRRHIYNQKDMWLEKHWIVCSNMITILGSTINIMGRTSMTIQWA